MPLLICCQSPSFGRPYIDCPAATITNMPLLICCQSVAHMLDDWGIRYATQLLKLMMYLLEKDNEENAVICLRIILDLHKNFRHTRTHTHTHTHTRARARARAHTLYYTLYVCITLVHPPYTPYALSHRYLNPHKTLYRNCGLTNKKAEPSI